MEIIGSKPSSRSVSGYKETVVTWLNPKCQTVSNGDVPITTEISMALDIIEKLNHNAELDKIMYGYTQRKKPPMRQHQRVQ